MGRPGGDATPWVFSGTLVVKGHGVAVVKDVGVQTQLGKIGAALRTIEPENTPLQREIDRLVRIFATFGLAAATIVVIVYGLTRGHWLAGLNAGIACAGSTTQIDDVAPHHLLQGSAVLRLCVLDRVQLVDICVQGVDQGLWSRKVFGTCRGWLVWGKFVGILGWLGLGAGGCQTWPGSCRR